jgi:tetratricopeptide (TPR) repeat protein
MKSRPGLAILAFLLTLCVGGRCFADCQVEKTDLLVTMSGLRAILPAKINGGDTTFAVDSGAFYSFITPAKAAQFHLALAPMPGNFYLRGMGGSFEGSVATVETFTLAGAALRRIQFVVGGSDPGQDVAGLLGQNVLGLGDVEYDLANGAVRLMHPKGCEHKEFAYWAKHQNYSVMDIQINRLDHYSIRPQFTIGTAFVNGVSIRVMFDTGAPRTILSLAAAKRAGVVTSGAGFVPAGPSGGLGRGTYQTWIAPVGVFKIGSEEVHNTHLRIADTSIDQADMLLGADFFLSHRIYVANSQHKLYFTYNGGPVFDLSFKPTLAGGPAPEAGAKADEAGAPVDAEGFARRGAAFAARGDFARAIADLTRARDLAPGQATYAYQRAMAYLGNNQPFLAMTDLDQAIALAPDDVPARLARSRLLLAGRDRSRALADLDVIDRRVASQSDVRLELGGLYSRADALPAAVIQFGLWLKAHPEDSNGVKVHALNGRCWARALLGQDLDKALADCNAALKLAPKSASYLDSRGLVYLRQGALDKAIADFDAALTAQPKTAWSLYGRGIAKLRNGLTAEGQADIAAATALRPGLPEEARAHGIAP